MIYKDTYSGYLFPNHFENDILDRKEYDRVYKKLRRRVDRLFSCIENNNSILFVLACEISFSEADILELKNTLLKMYPEKRLDFRIMTFNAKSNEEKSLDNNISIYKYTRGQNLYDFIKTNYEWAWLDSLTQSISPRRNSIKIFSLKLLGYHLKLVLSWRASER